MVRFCKIICFVFLLSSINSCSNNGSGNFKKQNSTLNYKVISIDDGDTYNILMNNKSTKIRMDAIDAPEKGMPYWKVSKQFLSKMIFNKQVKIKITNTDMHGRIVARTYLEDGTDVSLEMIKAGLAWHYKKFNKESQLADIEKQAMRQKLGLWNDPNPYNPEYVRKLHRQGISTKDTFNLELK